MLAPSSSFVQDKLKPAQFPELARTISVRLPGGVSYPKGQVLGFRNTAAGNEVQTVTIGGGPTGGTFALGFLGVSGAYSYTAALPHNASVAAVQAALDALVGAGTSGSNVSVTGTPGVSYAVAFQGDYGNVDVPLMLAQAALTGGTSPTVTVAETTKGSPGGGTSAAAYAAGNADGTQTARCVLESAVATDGAGRRIGMFGPGPMTFPAFSKGDFLCSELPGLDAAAVDSLGRLVAGSAFNAAGAIVGLR